MSKKKNLSVDICGVKLNNPVIAASGCYGFGKEFAIYYPPSELGGISLKAITPLPRHGNPTPRVAETPSGILNAVGLQNPGIDAFIKEELPRLKDAGTMLMANIAGSTIDDYIHVAKKLRGTDIDLIELNISCPNVGHGGMAFGTDPKMAKDITRVVKDVCDKPLIVKLTPNITDIVEIAQAVCAGGADGISLINTITGLAVDANTRRPILGNITGGLSGPAIKPIALRMVWQVASAVDVPIIGMGGIMTGLDAIEFMLCGASAVMVGTANLTSPMAVQDIIRGIEDYMVKFGIDDISSIVGTLKI